MTKNLNNVIKVDQNCSRCNRQKVLPEKKYSRDTFFLRNKYSLSTYYPVKKYSHLGKSTSPAIFREYVRYLIYTDLFYEGRLKSIMWTFDNALLDGSLKSSKV